MAIKNLANGKKEQAGEFYTQLEDIEKELRHYRKQFKNKIVYCNFDDCYESNFFKYFALNFNVLGLKKLICTCYDESQVIGKEISLFAQNVQSKAYKIEINEVKDFNKDGAVDMLDVEYLLKNKKNALSLLKGDGSFDSPECIKILEKCDIVVTNPAFYTWSDLINLLTKHKKKFILIGNTNALAYQETFRLFQKDKIRTGYTNFNTGMFFYVPDTYSKYHKMKDNRKMCRVSSSCWFTNLPVKRDRHIDLYKKYNKKENPKYDNYDAIDVATYTDIPYDYDGIMGVPVTFLDKYDPKQFELVTLAKTPIGNNFRTKIYGKQIQHDKSGKTSEVTKLNDGASIKVKVAPTGDKPYYTIGKDIYIAPYVRVLIRRKNDEN